MIKKKFIQSKLASVVSNMKTLAESANISTIFVDGLVPKRTLYDEFLFFAKYKTSYDQIRILNTEGRELLRVNNNNDQPYTVQFSNLQLKNNRYYFKKILVLHKGEIYISPFDLNVEHGEIEKPIKPTIRFGSPLFDSNDNVIGAIIINYNGLHLLESIKQITLNSEGSFMMLNKEGYWLFSEQASDEWGFMYDDRHETNFPNRYPTEWSEIVSADSGQILNAKGLFTFTTLRYPTKFNSHTFDAESSGSNFWKLVSFVPKNEIRQGLRSLLVVMFVIDTFLLMLIGLGLWYLTTTKIIRQNTELELRRSNYKLNRILETTSEGFWFIDNNTVTISVNPAMCKILDRDVDEIVGKSIYEFVDDENKKIFKNQVYLRKKGKVGAYEISLSRPDNSLVSCLFNATPFSNETGIKAGSFALVTDITARVTVERNLHDAKIKAESANAAKSLFLSSMSHELRTPLNSILGFTQLLESDTANQLSPEQITYTHRILNSGVHLLHLIDDVLDLAKIESGSLELSIEPVDMCNIVIDVLESVKPEAQLRNITIIPHEPDQPLFVRADIIRFRQVVLNLLSNAIKYNRENGEIHLRCIKGEKATQLIVTDSGLGIEKDKIERLFEPFDRLGVEASSIKGTGIGLTITKQLIEKMGGIINVESKVGSGSKFIVDIPNAPTPVKTVSVSTKTAALNKTTVSGEYLILYVEDNMQNRQLFKAILKRTPHLKLVTAINGEQGVEMAVELKPDLIFMDLNLPGMDGFEALRKIRSFDETRNTSVVALSGNAMPLDIKKALDSGFEKYLTKPFNISELYKTINILLAAKDKEKTAVLEHIR